MAAACLGFALGQARLHAVAAPILAREGVYAVEGRVVDLAPLPSGERLLLDQRDPWRAVPRRHARHHPGQSAPGASRPGPRRPRPAACPAAATLCRHPSRVPSTSPGRPGSTAWVRWASHLGRPSVVPGKQTGWALAIAALRSAIARRIAEENPGPAGAMAAALVAGVRAGIDQATWRAMQISGLAHILSVSGLHMVLVAGSVFRHLPLAAGAVSAARIPGACEEDRGRGRGVGRGLLPGPVGRDRANPALVPDDRGRACSR